METKKLIGLRIKELRKSKNYTQEKLAELINLDISSISKVEQGLSTPSIPTFEKIAQTLGVEIKDFFDFSHLNKIDRKREINRIYNSLNEEKQITLYRIAKSFE